MVSKDLKKLSRRELVDIIYQMKKNEQQMHTQIANLQELLQDKRLRISMAGSVAEAALSISDVFSAAQLAADRYLEEIACMKQDAEAECEKLIRAAKEKSEQMISEAELHCSILSEQYHRECEKWYKLHQEVQKLQNEKDRRLRED